MEGKEEAIKYGMIEEAQNSQMNDTENKDSIESLARELCCVYFDYNAEEREEVDFSLWLGVANYVVQRELEARIEELVTYKEGLGFYDTRISELTEQLDKLKGFNEVK